ncbi:MAG: HEAT repeat domain-containing protein [Eubacteriales bacterium]|nr:HEAT repeat domain-containing protein [Eubacteriales bacterium]
MANINKIEVKIKELMVSAESADQKQSDKAIRAIIKYFGHKDSEIRKTAVGQFGEIEFERTLPYLIDALTIVPIMYAFVPYSYWENRIIRQL